MRSSYQIPIVFILVLSVILVFGCSKDNDLLGPEPGPYKFSASPDILMENFQKAYSAMDLEGYGSLLHEDFIFSFMACDVEKLGLSQDHFTREDELITAEHMFARQAYVKTSGQVVAPILAITFLRFEREGDWVPMDDPDQPGLLKGNYLVDIVMDRGREGSLSIRGTCVFFVAGSGSAGYQLIGWVDRTGGC